MKKRVLFSEDETQFGFVFNNVRGRMPTVEDINAYVDYFLGTDITDFSMTLNGTISVSPSKIFETYADKYEQKELFGKTVNFKDSFARTYYHVQRVLGVNHFQIWIDRLRAGGRVSNAAYLGAKLLSLHPLIEILDGKLMSTKKYRGSMAKVVSKLVSEYSDGLNTGKPLYFIYGKGLDEEIKRDAERIVQEKGFASFKWIETGCVIAAHSGPGSFGIVGFAK